jgi:hypothetical protein
MTERIDFWFTFGSTYTLLSVMRPETAIELIRVSRFLNESDAGSGF